MQKKPTRVDRVGQWKQSESGEIGGEVDVASLADLEAVGGGDVAELIDPAHLDRRHRGEGGIGAAIDDPVGKGEDEVPVGWDILMAGEQGQDLELVLVIDFVGREGEQ